MARSEAHARDEDVEEVFGTAIDTAVRRAVDLVGREPLVLEPTDEDPEPEPGSLPRTRRPRIEDELEDRRPVVRPIPLPKGRLDGIDPYAILGVSKTATWEQITAAYKRRARAWHPDGADPAEVERRGELIRQLNVAYALVRKRRKRPVS